LAGNATANPQPPALPARSHLLATLNVPVAGGGAPTVSLNKAKFVAAGGILPIYSKPERETLSPYLGMEIQRMDLTLLGPAGVRERYNGTNWDHFGHTEFTAPANTAAPNTVWGLGIFTRDTNLSTDDSFVTSPAQDVLRVRDAGVYSITVMVSFTEVLSGVSWMSVDGNFTTTMGGGLQNFITTQPNVRLGANATINPVLAQGSSGNRTFTSRVRITRIA
jgi:hypothetical protein